MRKFIIPALILILSGVVLTLCTLAKNDVVLGFSPSWPTTINWNEEFPHYMRIRKLLPSQWKNYPRLFEQCYLYRSESTKTPDKMDLGRIKSSIMLAFMTGEMRQYLAARQFEAIIIIIISLWWMVRMIGSNKNTAQQGGPAYPPQGVGSADP